MESKSEKILHLKNKIEIVAKHQMDIVNSIQLNSKELSVLEEKIKTETDDVKKKDLELKVDLLKAECVDLNDKYTSKTKMLEDLNKELGLLLVTPFDKVKQNAWEVKEKLKPSIEEISLQTREAIIEKTKSIKDDVKKNISSDKINQKVEALLETEAVKKIGEKSKEFSDDVKKLNFYKIIGKLKRNVDEAVEDINNFVKNKEIDKDVKSKVDKYVTEEQKKSIHKFMNKIKNTLDEAVEVIQEGASDENEAEEIEKKRRFRELKMDYLKDWLKKYNVVVDNSGSSFEEIHKEYVKFMFEEYHQNTNSKLIFSNREEFAIACAKILSLQIVLMEGGLINLKINK